MTVVFLLFLSSNSILKQKQDHCWGLLCNCLYIIVVTNKTPLPSWPWLHCGTVWEHSSFLLLNIKVTPILADYNRLFPSAMSSCCFNCDSREGVVSKCHVPECSLLFSPVVLHVSALDKEADCTITMADSDLLALMTGKMNPQSVSTMWQTFVGQYHPVCYKCPMNLK